MVLDAALGLKSRAVGLRDGLHEAMGIVDTNLVDWHGQSRDYYNSASFNWKSQSDNMITILDDAIRVISQSVDNTTYADTMAANGFQS